MSEEKHPSHKEHWRPFFLLCVAAFALFWFRPGQQPSVKPLLIINTGERTRVESIAFSPDGQNMALGVTVWPPPKAKVLPSSEAQLRDAKTGALLQSVWGATSGPSVAFTPNGDNVIFCAGQIKTWNLQTQKWHQFNTSAVNDYWTALSSDGKVLASSGENTIHLWDVASGKLLRTLEGHNQRVISLAFSPDGQRLASASYDGTIKLWDVKTGALERTLVGRPGHMMSCVAFSPDNKTIASGDGLEIRLWSAQSGQLLQTITPENRVFALAFSPDGKTLANAGPLFHNVRGETRGPHGGLLVPRETISAGEVWLWDVETGRWLQTFSDGHWALNIVFSPDGKRLAQMSDDNTVRIWPIKPRDS